MNKYFSFDSICKIFYLKKETFLILSFFLLLHFYMVKKKINWTITFFIVVTQEASNNYN